MKVVFLALLVTASNAFATGEYTIFTCTSGTKAGDVVTISGCVAGEGDQLVSCGDEGVSYITVTKENWAGITKMTPPVIESVKIPGVYFDFQWEEELFSLKMDNAELGKVTLNLMSGEAVNGLQQLDLNTKTFKNSFKVVGCEFTSNPMN